MNKYEILEALTGVPAADLALFDLKNEYKTVTISHYPKNPGIWLIECSHIAGLDYYDLLKREGVKWEVVKEHGVLKTTVKLTKNGAPFVYNKENVALLERLAREWEK